MRKRQEQGWHSEGEARHWHSIVSRSLCRGEDSQRPCEKEENTMPTKRYPPQRAYGWFRLPVLVIGALVLLAACGGSNTPSTDTATPTPASGSAQLLMILTNSNGSFGFS